MSDELLLFCSVPGCQKTPDCRGWCRMHYKRWQAHGDPLVALIGNDPALRFWAKVDKNGPIIVRDEHWPPNAPDPPGTPCWVWTRACDPEG